MFWCIYSDDSLWYIFVSEFHVDRESFYSLHERIICYMAGSTSGQDEANSAIKGLEIEL